MSWLVVALVLSWLLVIVLGVALCVLAGRADRLAERGRWLHGHVPTSAGADRIAPPAKPPVPLHRSAQVKRVAPLLRKRRNGRWE